MHNRDNETFTALVELNKQSSREPITQSSSLGYHDLSKTSSPQERLPSEILAHIFVCAYQSVEGIRFPVELYQIPWVVGRVCARWREVARAEPLLWNNVSVGLHSRRLPQVIAFLESTLLDSGELSMTIYHGEIYSNALVTAIGPYSSRLTRLHLQMSTDILPELAELPRHAFGAITDLTISVGTGQVSYDERWSEGPLRDLKFFQHMRQLRKLRIQTSGDTSGIMTGALASNPYIPYSQLTHLDLEHVQFTDVESLVSVLRSCLSVQSIRWPSLSGTILPADTDPFLPNVTSVSLFDPHLLCIPIPWGNLTTLSLPLHIKLEEVCHILEKTPRLESLTIYTRLNERVTQRYQPMIPLINLHSLSISSQDTCLIPYLTAPVVRNLHIQFIDGPEEEPYPQKSAIIVLDFLDQGLPLETLTLGIELGDKYVAHSRIITLPDLQTLYISSKDPWALVHLQTPKIRNLCVRLSRIETDNREAQENYPNVLEFLERSSQLGFTFIRFDEWCSWDPPVVITLRPLFIPEKEDWIVDRLHRYYLAPDTRLPEDEVRDFIRRSGCTPVLSLHVDQFEEC